MVKTVSNGCFTSNLASVAPRFRGEMLRVWVYTRASSSYAEIVMAERFGVEVRREEYKQDATA